MSEVTEVFQRELTTKQARQIVALTSKVWPDSSKTFEQRMQFILKAAESADPEQYESKRFLVWEDGMVTAHARTFSRRIFVDDEPRDVLALASVCTAENARGRGLGKLVVTAAFSQVDQGLFECSLFQTGVPEFYERLNCRIIENKIVDRTNVNAPQAYPFRDEFAMVYPATIDWPQGTIDLNGKGY